MYSYQLDCYERAIREPNEQQETSTINCYVHLCLELSKSCNSKEQANRIYSRMINTFQECVCDDLLSHSWRMHCVKTFRQIKPILYEIFDR